MISNKLKYNHSCHNIIELGKRFIQCLCLKAVIFEFDGKIEQDYIEKMSTCVIQTVGKGNKDNEQDFVQWAGEGFCADDEEKRREVQQYIEEINKKGNNQTWIVFNPSKTMRQSVAKKNQFNEPNQIKDIKQIKKANSNNVCLDQDQYARPKEIDVSYYLNSKIKSKNAQLSVLCQQFGFIKTPWEEYKQDNQFIQSISVEIDSTESLLLKKRTVVGEGRAKNKQTAKQLACHYVLLQIYMNCTGVYSSMIDKKAKKAIST